MIVHSWDLFDTLIGRKCGTAQNLFEQMAHHLGDSLFPTKRIRAEGVLQDKKTEYSLEDIYKIYYELFPGTYPDLARLEFQFELNNVFAIRRNVEKLQPQDIVVSDMYLTEGLLRTLVEKAGIHFSGDILVSNYGKQTGIIWPHLKGRITSHCGDNRHSDLIMPGKFGIRARDARTELSSLEKNYNAYSPRLGWWARHHRLEYIVDEINLDRLNFLQIELNAPLLRVACELLKAHVNKNPVSKILFMSRDGQMFERMWRRLYPQIPSEYLYISRECLRGYSPDYFQYLNHLYKEDTLMVDLAASCGSLKIALPKLSNSFPKFWTLIFLPGFNVNHQGIDLAYATTNNETHINNTWLEMLNYADHWHVSDYKNGQPVFDQMDEYDMKHVLLYQRYFQKMLETVPTDKMRDADKLLRIILPLISNEGMYLRKLFPNHLAFEQKRKRSFEVKR